MAIKKIGPCEYNFVNHFDEDEQRVIRSTFKVCLEVEYDHEDSMVMGILYAALADVFKRLEE